MKRRTSSIKNAPLVLRAPLGFKAFSIFYALYRSVRENVTLASKLPIALPRLKGAFAVAGCELVTHSRIRVLRYVGSGCLPNTYQTIFFYYPEVDSFKASDADSNILSFIDKVKLAGMCLRDFLNLWRFLVHIPAPAYRPFYLIPKEVIK